MTEINPSQIGEMTKVELLRSRLKTDISLKDLESLSEASQMAKHVQTILDQIKHLKTAVENTIELSKIKGMRASEGGEGIISSKNLITRFIHLKFF